MSSSHDITELVPGDLIVAEREMRAWVNEDVRGDSNAWIHAGEQAIVVETWLVGNQRRVRVFRNQKFLLFSCKEHCTFRNWKVAVPAPRLPASGCP